MAVAILAKDTSTQGLSVWDSVGYGNIVLCKVQEVISCPFGLIADGTTEFSHP
jgi:hypothetical protein